MFRKLILHFASKRNPQFQLDKRIGSAVLFAFLFEQCLSLTRGLLRQLLAFQMPQLLFLGKRVRIDGFTSLHLGKQVRIANDVACTAWSEEGIAIGDYSWIGSHSILRASFSLNQIGKGIRIGKHVGLGDFAHLGGAGGLTIGDDCIIGPYFSCHPENHDFLNMDVSIRLQGTSRKGIVIGKNCWIGAKVTVLDGVHIGNNCVIAAGAVVTKDLPENAVAAGVPARILRYRDHENNQQAFVA